jgi:hypothetical protein
MNIQPQTPRNKTAYRKALSLRFCKLNDLEPDNTLTSNDRRELVRKGVATKRLNNGHKLNIMKKMKS